MLAVSILSIKDNLAEEVKKLDKLHLTYFHLDIMDGIFVENKTLDIEDYIPIFKKTKTPIEVHLMVKDIKKYVDEYSELDPEYITFHYEASNNIFEDIEYIKSKGIRVGISIKPNTPVEAIKPYLDYIDLVLIMSVEPGMGGQKYIPTMKYKVNELRQIRSQENYDFLISIDGGINNNTIDLVKSDMYVVGSYITSGEYKERIKILEAIINEEE